ncbi:MAG TPA: hypothetical protein VGP63_18260, partial [Planctomycetaceae bacterium]|nr:hypothetical protein [Planctomycetaceae bacterium]
MRLDQRPKSWDLANFSEILTKGIRRKSFEDNNFGSLCFVKAGDQGRMMPAKKKQVARGKKQERLSLAPLTPEEALKRMLGGSTQETRPESMVPRAKPKSRKNDGMSDEPKRKTAGYVIAIRRTEDGPVEWLGEINGELSPVSDRSQAKYFRCAQANVYPALKAALAARRRYCETHADVTERSCV